MLFSKKACGCKIKRKNTEATEDETKEMNI
jgi:hypothetical protein